MASKPISSKTVQDALAASWLPLVIIVLAQLQMGFNVSAIPVSIGPIAADLNAPATAISTALVVYSLFVAAFVMLGAKIGKLFGERLIFQISVVAHGIAMVIMAVSADANSMNTAQLIAGVAAALLVPTLVVLIAANYRDQQQSQALGILSAIPAIASGVAFVLAGWIATALSWRYSFALIAILSVVVFILSFRLTPIPRQKHIKIDLVGVVLSAAAIALILYAFNNINNWGLLLASDRAPFSILGISPVPIMLVLGLVLGQAFFVWTEKRVADKKTPLLALEVLDSSEEKNAVIAFLVAGALSSAVSFLIPLYIQFVQGRTPFQTAIAIVPYAIAVAAAAILSLRLYSRFNPRVLGVISFVFIAVGAAFVAFAISGEWGTLSVILGLILLGLGEGAMLTLLFNVLVSASPKELAGDVGALRGVANNVSSALGAAFAGVVAVGILGLAITTAFNRSDLPPALATEINFDKINFVSNDQLKVVLAKTSATSEQIDQAVQINADARLRSLRATFLLIAAISLLSIFPAVKLPKNLNQSLSAEDIVSEKRPAGSQATDAPAQPEKQMA